MSWKQKNVVFFDHDGTLVDSEFCYYQIWKDTIGEFGEQFNLKMYQDNCVGIPSIGNAEYLKSIFPLTGSAENLVAKKEENAQAFLSKTGFPLMSGAKEALHHFKANNFKTFIVSGSERSAVLDSVERHNLDAFIEEVVTGDQVARNKPFPDVYLKAIELAGALPQNCFAVEDSEHGVQAATTAGIDCVAIPNEHTHSMDFSKASMVQPSLASFLQEFLRLSN